MILLTEGRGYCRIASFAGVFLYARCVVIIDDDFYFSDEANTSGIWEPVRSFMSDRDRLANISLQAHRAAQMASPNEEIDAVMFDTKTLLFCHDGYNDIYIDLIRYSVTNAPENYIYICKGLAPDCVHFLVRMHTPGIYFFLGQHVCNVTI